MKLNQLIQGSQYFGELEAEGSNTHFASADFFPHPEKNLDPPCVPMAVVVTLLGRGPDRPGTFESAVSRLAPDAVLILGGGE